MSNKIGILNTDVLAGGDAQTKGPSVYLTFKMLIRSSFRVFPGNE
jgi:hypothetical protein